MEEQDFFLIDLIKENNVLYDKSRADFKDKIKKENVWKCVAKEMNLTITECMNRWQNLKDKFTREKKEIENFKSGMAAKQKEESDLYKAMNFMKTHIVYRKRLPKNNSSVSKNNVEEEKSNSQFILPGIELPVLQVEVDNEILQTVTERTSTTESECTLHCDQELRKTFCKDTEGLENTPARGQRIKKRKLEENLNNHLEKMSLFLENKSNTVSTPSPFFTALNEEFKKVKPKKQKQLKLTLMQMVIDFQSDSE